MKNNVLILSTSIALFLSGCVMTPPSPPVNVGDGEYVYTVSGRESEKGEKYLNTATQGALDFCWAKEGTSSLQIIASDTRDAVNGYPAISRIRFLCR